MMMNCALLRLAPYIEFNLFIVTTLLNGVESIS